MRGRRERELEPEVSSEVSLGAAIRTWRRVRGLTVTDLAISAGFGKSGRGYISKIEHNQIKRLGEEYLAAIARALDLSPADLQQGRLPETSASLAPDKATLDAAILGCRAWLRLYGEEGPRLDRARTYFALAELCWKRVALTEGRDASRDFLDEAHHYIQQALHLFREEAPGSYEEAMRLYKLIARETFLNDLDNAIAGSLTLLNIVQQTKRPLDWARVHARLAQLYWDRATYSDQPEERQRWLSKAQQSLDHALPLFCDNAPTSYTLARQLRNSVEAARNEYGADVRLY